MSATDSSTTTKEEAKAPEVKVEATGEQAAASTETPVKTEQSEEAAKAEETKPDAASGEDSKPAATGETAAANGDDKPAEDAKEGDKSSRIRLNGAARNRFRYLLKNGFTRDEAAELAKSPDCIKQFREGTLNGSGKRPNSNGSAGGPASKQAKTEVYPVRMVVATENHPATKLTNEQADKIKSGILKQVVLQKDSALKPHFEDCIFFEGYLLVKCSDKPTVDWLIDVVPKLELWQDATVKVASEKSLLRSEMYIAVFADSIQDENKDILSFVESQNDGVDTSKWNIIGRKENKSKKEVELMFFMDNVSAKLIQKKKFELNYKFAKVVLRKKKQFNPAPGSNVPPAGNVNARRPNNGPPPAKNPRTFNQNPSSSFVPIWDNNLPNFGNNNARFNNGGGRDFNRGGNPNRNSGGGGQFDNRNRSNNGNSFGGGNNGPRGNARNNRPRSLLDQLMHTVNSANSNGSRRGGNGVNAFGFGGGRPNNRNNRNSARTGFF